MNIFNHLIKDTEIIGVGEINASDSDAGCRGKTIQYSFKVYTKASSILICSPAFNCGDAAKADAWLKKYLQVRNLISLQIGELTESE